MDTEETVEMSSPLEAGVVEETISSSEGSASKESCSSCKTSDENGTDDFDSNVSSVSLIVQPSSSYNDSNQDMSLAQLSNIELVPGSDTSIELVAPTEVNSEGSVLAPLCSDGKIQVSVSLVSTENKPDEPTKKSSQDQQSTDSLERCVGGDSAGNDTSLIIEHYDFHVSYSELQNASPVQPIGDASIQGHLLEEKQLPACGKDSDKSPLQTPPNVDARHSEMIDDPTPNDRVIVQAEILSKHEPVVTIMKPKTQNVHHNEQVARVQSESLGQPPKNRCFLLEDIVSGRLDLGENAEVLDDLIYWRDPKKTGFIFVVGLSILLSLQYYSFISVMAYLSLALLTCGILNRLCATTQRSFHPLTELNSSLSEESMKRLSDGVAYYVNDTVLAIRRLYMVEDVGDSIKFGLVLWYLTYVGLWFNGMTIVTICFVTIFTLPNIYMRNKEKVDENLGLFWGKWLDLSNKARTLSRNSLSRILSVEGRHEKTN